jgi:hypothetical protein
VGLPFRQVWAVDFEFIAAPGERPDPVCMVARELTSNTTIRLWQDELRTRRLPPFSTGADTLLVAYYASAELGCFLELDWPLPERVLDLFAEFRQRTNGAKPACGSGLIGALAAFGLDSIDAAEKDTMRNLVMRGGPWSETERRDILAYCETDVDALAQLLPAMVPRIDLPRALLRGRYMTAAARMERTGIPIDTELHGRLVANWGIIRQRLIGKIDADYGIYDGTTFKHDRFAAWLAQQRIPWPHLESGKLALDEDTFRSMAKAHPQVAPLHELRATLSQLKLNDLAIGHDGRGRCLLSAFAARSSRNAPSTSKFAFGPAVWIRGLICPPPGRALAYVDWSQQEFAIAAALSGDPHMIAAYQSGDPYLEFAKLAGAVPSDATKASHGPQRELYKITTLATQYGMEAKALAARIGRSELEARNLLRHHRQVFRRFWDWSDAAADRFNLLGELPTTFGWILRNAEGKSDRTARNFPMQANGAEMMRIAACLVTEAGLEVCAPVHDAFLIEADETGIEQAAETAQRHMATASRAVLAGFELRSDVKIIRHPERYADPRGERMFETVTELLGELETSKAAERTEQSGYLGAPVPHERAI